MHWKVTGIPTSNGAEEACLLISLRQVIEGIRSSNKAEEACVIISSRQVIERFHSCMIGTQLDAVWACISITAEKDS